MNLGLDREVTAVSRLADACAVFKSGNGFMLMFQINLHFFGCHIFHSTWEICVLPI